MLTQKYHVGVVVDSVGVVMGCEGVGRHRSSSGALLLGGFLWKRLHLERHVSVVVVVVGSSVVGIVGGDVFGGDVGVVCGGVGVVCVALFADNLFVVIDFVL